MAKKAIIIGGSLSGLMAGTVLRRAGWDVSIYERSAAPLESRGGGIVVHPQVLELLRLLQLDAGSLAGVRTSGKMVLDGLGHVSDIQPTVHMHTTWNALYSLLREEFGSEAYHHNTKLFWVFQAPGSVMATFADGRKVEGDLLVGADGIRSTVRERCFGNVPVPYAGYVAWRGLVPERLVEASAAAVLGDALASYEYDSAQMVSFLVANQYLSTAVGTRDYNWVWYQRTAAADLPTLLTDRHGTLHGAGVAPADLAPGVENRLREQAQTELCPPMRALVRATRQPFVHAIHDLESETLVRGRVCLIGEAAFSARPHTGASTSKAASNVVALARSLKRHGDDVPAALEDWEGTQLALGHQLVEYGRRLWAEATSRSI